MDLEWISKVRVNTQSVLKRAQHVQGLKVSKNQWQAAWLLKAVTCMDLTTLAGDDTPSNVQRLCVKALQPVRSDLLRNMDMHDKEDAEEPAPHPEHHVTPQDTLDSSCTFSHTETTRRSTEQEVLHTAQLLSL
ncbi:deoxyribose-phosphate aldolase-like [Nematolebias whitei]|uniref:deoxyribose-phosphate aldolase-like n=1 Tax=Nematolebias whitei TaxID=451745 RepID=UPI001896D4D1|nr:deoxyribose-phosphate aldolase-like [Nematolebias whitei]